MDEKDPVFRELIAAKVAIMFASPFYGSLISRLELIEADGWCKTAATDGRRLYFNREFVKGLDAKNGELAYLILHEILHVCFLHVGRTGKRDPKISNMAMDYIVNDCINKSHFNSGFKVSMPKGGLIDDRYTCEMSYEEVYALLIENSTTIKMPLDQHINLAGGSEDGDDDGDGDEDEDGGGKTAKVTIMGKNGKPNVTKEDIENIQAQIRAEMIQAAQQYAGHTPLGIKRMIGKLIEPKMDWRSLLDVHIRSSVRDDFTFARASRRSTERFIFPGQDYANTIDICVCIDVSGSMTEDMLRDLLSEVKGIMQAFTDFKLRLWSFDTKCYSYKEFGPQNLDEIDTWDAKGGGGTSFECVYEFMKENDIEPIRLVFFTDGYPNYSWGDENYCDTLFIIYANDAQNIVAPYGTTAYYEPRPKDGK